MKFRRLGAVSLAAALMATSTAIVASADDAQLNGTVEISDFNAQLYGMGTTNWSWVTGATAGFTESDGKASLTISAKGGDMNNKGDATVQFGIQFYVGTDASGNGDLAIGDKYSTKVTYKITGANGVIAEGTADLAKEVSKNQWGAGIDGTATVFQQDVSKEELEAYGDITATVELTEIKYTKDGKDGTLTAGAGAAPAETTAAETTKEETKEETTAAPVADEDEDTTAAADEDLVEDDDDDDAAAAALSAEDLADLDLDALAAEVGYDYAGAVASNAAFELGGKIDLIAALGENWDKFTTIEADFSWTPGEKWCGGAGIGAAINCNGDTWIMGDEFGAANANEAVAPDGKATQTILKMAGPLISPVSIGEDGSVGFGELQVQNWWNGTEAGAKVDAIRFLDDNGNVVAELNYSAAAADVAPVVAPATGDVEAATDSSKGSPDTGVADVAAVAGLAVLAAGAVVVAKKRK